MDRFGFAILISIITIAALVLIILIIYLIVRPPACVKNCNSKMCGEDDGCGGKCLGPCPGLNKCRAGIACTNAVVAMYSASAECKGSYSASNMSDVIYTIPDGQDIVAAGTGDIVFNFSSDLVDVVFDVTVIAEKDSAVVYSLSSRNDSVEMTSHTPGTGSSHFPPLYRTFKRPGYIKFVVKANGWIKVRLSVFA